MLNPDGVIHGHYRNNILGKDLNRMWQDPRATVTPTIYYLKKLISINKPHFFCDFHGHSNMPNCALYCCSPPKKKKKNLFNYHITNTKSYHFYEEKVFMRIFEEEAKFYEKTGEKYTIQKSKQKSARGVLYNEFNIYLSYALETGLMAKYTKQSNNNGSTTDIILEPSTISEYNQIGCDYISSLVKWDTKSKFYAVLKKIREEEENKRKEKEIKNSKLIHNSMMIIPQFIENEIKTEILAEKDELKNDNMNNKK